MKHVPCRVLILLAALSALPSSAFAQTPVQSSGIPAQPSAKPSHSSRSKRIAKPVAPKPLPQLIGSIAAHPGWPQPKPSDVSSPEGILTAVYDVISGPAGQPRDWNRMRSLFLPDARLIPATVLPGSPSTESPNTDAVMLTIEDYIARSTARTATVGFFEQSIHNEAEQYGNIVQIWSTYESRHAANDLKPFARGINSFQLLKDGGRYWVVNIFWGAETPTSPIPSIYLPLADNAEAGTAKPTTAAATISPATLNANFNGDWVGTLEYRDYKTNEQTFLPTWLTLNPQPDGNTIRILYTYDDGPARTVRETSILTLSPKTKTATFTSDFAKSNEPDDPFEVQGLPEFAKLGKGTLLMTGKGKENGHAVDVRITLTLRRNLYSFRKETRAAGEEFKFRDAYTFTRAQVPRT